MKLILDEKISGVKAKSIKNVIERLLDIEWYNSTDGNKGKPEELLGQLLETINVSGYTIKWLSKEELPEKLNKISLSDSKIWDRMKELPGQFRNEIYESKQGKLIAPIVEIVSEPIFHHSFDSATKVFRDEKVVQFLVVQAMYFAVLICLAELANESIFALRFIELLSTGHVPVALKGDIIYII